MLSTRLATAALGIPAIFLVVWVGDALLAVVSAVAAFIACIEFAMVRQVHRKPLAVLAAACGAALPLIALAGEAYLLAGIIGAIGLISAGYTTTKDPPADLETWLWGIVSALYFGGLAAHFVLVRDLPDGRDWLFLTLITVWVADTGAYAVGHTIGKHKMAPYISPAKTIEGAAGSVVTGLIAVVVLHELFDLGLDIGYVVALGLLLQPVIMIGDLAESAMKRALRIKDSSNLIPGHGGVADRLDSLLFAAPLVYYFLRFVV